MPSKVAGIRWESRTIIQIEVEILNDHAGFLARTDVGDIQLVNMLQQFGVDLPRTRATAFPSALSDAEALNTADLGAIL